MEGAPAPSASSPTASGVIAPSSPAASSPGGSLDSPSSASGTSGVPEHTPPRRRLVKASSIIAKREAGATGVGAGPPGFGLDRPSGTSPAASSGAGSGSAGASALGVPPSASTSTSTFRERAGIRPLVKSDVQGEFPMMPAHGSGGSCGPAKLGRPPFVPNGGILGEIRPLGRRSELNSQRRHEPPAVQKHAPEELRIQQAKRACIARAQNMGATGNYKNFDSPFGNYMVPVIPNHLFNKTPTSSPTLTQPSGLSPGVGR